MLAAPPPKRVTAPANDTLMEPAPAASVPAEQDNSPPVAKEEPKEEPKAEPAMTSAEPVRPAPEPAESSPAAATPVFRTRADLGKPAPVPIPAVIPIVRAPDDPGIDDEGPSDEFTEQIGTPKAQAGGWRGFWSRWGA
ncbi:hypothetical protein AB7M41_001816 [Bradyrhizobium diazoefficiens]